MRRGFGTTDPIDTQGTRIIYTTASHGPAGACYFRSSATGTAGLRATPLVSFWSGPFSFLLQRLAHTANCGVVGSTPQPVVEPDAQCVARPKSPQRVMFPFGRTKETGVEDNTTDAIGGPSGPLKRSTERPDVG